MICNFKNKNETFRVVWHIASPYLLSKHTNYCNLGSLDLVLCIRIYKDEVKNRHLGSLYPDNHIDCYHNKSCFILFHITWRYFPNYTARSSYSCLVLTVLFCP